MQILFSEPIQPSSLGQVQLLENGSPMVVTQTLSNGNQTLTLTPNALFAQGLAHSIKITGVKDVAGNVLSGTVTATFTTGSSDDLNQNLPAPTFSPTTTGVSVNIHPTVTFSQPVNPVSAFSGGVVLLLTSNSTVVPATYSVSADGLTVTIIPNSPLAATTQYTIRNDFQVDSTDLASGECFRVRHGQLYHAVAKFPGGG